MCSCAFVCVFFGSCYIGCGCWPVPSEGHGVVRQSLGAPRAHTSHLALVCVGAVHLLWTWISETPQKPICRPLRLGSGLRAGGRGQAQL
jgi:hypothetical protein